MSEADDIRWPVSSRRSRWRHRSHVKPQQTRECFQKVLFHGDTITPTNMKANTMNLSLLRSPEVPTGCSPEPLRNRVQSRLDLLKPKVMRPPSPPPPLFGPRASNPNHQLPQIESDVQTVKIMSLHPVISPQYYIIYFLSPSAHLN